MASRDEIKSTIMKYIESANNSELAGIYDDVIGCGSCPYWHECRNEHYCFEYILGKLVKDDDKTKG